MSTDIEAEVDFAVFFEIKDGERGITNPTIKLHVVSSTQYEKIKEKMVTRFTNIDIMIWS